MVDDKSKRQTPVRDETMMLNTKLETLNSKQTQMSQTQNSKTYEIIFWALNFGFI